MRVSSILVLATLGAISANRNKSFKRIQISRCEEICGVQSREEYDLKKNLPKSLPHHQFPSERELVQESVLKRHKTLYRDRERRLHCIRKCLEPIKISNRATVLNKSLKIRFRSKRVTDSRKTQCPSFGPSSAMVYNTSVKLTRYRGNWSIVVSWNALKDTSLRWTSYNVAWNDLHKMSKVGINEVVPFTCIITPKNQTTLRITEQDGWTYPHSIQLVVTTYPTAAPNSPVKKYHFLKATTIATVRTTRPLSGYSATTSFTAPLRSQGKPAVTITPSPAASDKRLLLSTSFPNRNLKPGQIGAICAGIIVGVALVASLLLRVRQIGSSSTKPLSEAQVFVSYSRADYQWVNENLLRLMDRHNITYLIDYKDFEPGRPWIETMVECIQRSHKVLVIMSQEYMNRKNCLAELQQAMYWARVGTKLVVLRINNVDKCTLPGSIRNRTFIDYADRIERQTWKKRLVNILNTARTARMSNQPQVSIKFSNSDTLCETKV